MLPGDNWCDNNNMCFYVLLHWICVDHLVSHQLLSTGVLTILDTSYDKNICNKYCRNSSYNVNFWSEAEASNNEIYDILCMPLH